MGHLLLLILVFKASLPPELLSVSPAAALVPVSWFVLFHVLSAPLHNIPFGTSSASSAQNNIDGKIKAIERMAKWIFFGYFNCFQFFYYRKML